MAQSDAAKGSRGINAFIVEKGMEGFTLGAKEEKMGIRASDPRSLQFTNVKVPRENQLAEAGSGFRFAMETLEGGRLGIAAQAWGIASGAFELAVDYSKERQSFGRPIADHQDRKSGVWGQRVSVRDDLG